MGFKKQPLPAMTLKMEASNDISKLEKYNHNFYISLSKKQNIPTYSTNIYFMNNSNKACCFNIDEFETSKKMIIDFISDKNELCECNVCFE
jgi:hypothetical protein